MKPGIFTHGIPFEFISRKRKALMGLSLLCLLLFHLCEDRSGAGYSMPLFMKYFKTYIGSGEVDVFLILSGFGLCYSYGRIGDRNRFRLHHVKKILVPYLLFCVPVLFVLRVLLLGTGFARFLKDVFFLSFFTDGFRLFWYIPCILICYMIFPCFCDALDLDKDPVGRRLRLVTTAGAVFLLGVILSISFGGFFGKTEMLLVRIPSFVGGICVGIRSRSREMLTEEGLAWYLALTAAAHYVASWGAYPLAGRPATALCTVFWLLLPVFLWEKVPEALKGTLPCRILSGCLAWCGERTLELYLVHVGIREILRNTGLNPGRYSVYLLILALSFPVSALLHRVSGYILKKLPDGRA
jgi:peptidoglycan/LPS O-acetylase OafA/YrhL